MSVCDMSAAPDALWVIGSGEQFARFELLEIVSECFVHNCTLYSSTYGHFRTLEILMDLTWLLVGRALRLQTSAVEI